MVNQIQKEYETLAAEFQKWSDVHGGLIPPSISAFAHAMYDKCIVEMAKHVEADDHEGANREPIIVICSALSFGMYLGMHGYKAEEMTMPSVLTTEDERRLLGGSHEPGEATDNGV